MTCPFPTPEVRRQQVAQLINETPVAGRVLLRARLYAETPAEGPAEAQGLEPKCRCSVCWVVRPTRLKWKEHRESQRYTCESDDCRKLWRKLSRTERAARAKAKARLIQAVQEGMAA